MSVVQGKLRTLERLRTCYLNQTLDARNYQFIHSTPAYHQLDPLHDEDGYTIDSEQIYSQRPPSPESPPISFQVHRPFKYSRSTGAASAARQVPLSDTRVTTTGAATLHPFADERDDSNELRKAKGRKRASTDPHSRASDFPPLSTTTSNPRDRQQASSRGTSTANSSDLSDEDDSEMDEALHRAALQIKFSKMPARRRTVADSSSSSSRRDSTTSKLSLKLPPLPTLPELSSGTNHNHHQGVISPARLSRRHSESSFLQPGSAVSLPAVAAEQVDKAAFPRRDTNSSTTSTDLFDGHSYGSSTFINRSSMDSLRAESDLSRNSDLRPNSDSRAYLYNDNFNGARTSERDTGTSLNEDRLAGDSTATEDVDTTENGEYDVNDAGYDTTSTEEEGTMATMGTSLMNDVSSPLSRKHVAITSNSVSADERSISYSSGRVSPDFSAKPVKLNAQASALSSLIQADRSGSNNPLDEYAVYAGSGTASSLCLKIYFPNSNRPTKPLTVILRSSVTVAEGIGYMLYLYQREKVEPAFTKEQYNPNSWNLQIVEEDGVPDEDFPALERTRRLSAFSFDEFALVEATSAQTQENEKVTPSRNNAVGPDMKAQVSGQSAKGVNGAKSGESSITINVLLFSSDDTVSSVKLAVNPQTKLDDILTEVCQTTNLNRNDYILRIPGSRYTASGDTPVKALEGKSELELCPISFVGGMIIRRPKPDRSQLVVDGSSEVDGMARRGSTSQIQTVIQGAKPSSSREFSAGRRGPTEELLEQPKPLLPEAISRATYRKYQVWRRQPMSFINRHERILAIDGEYVHIMPSGDRTWFESPKTTSFHIGAIINCKQSRKMPTHFKIVISKGRESKRYDLEAISRSQAADIVGHLRKYAVAYRNDIRNNRQSQIPA